MLHDKFVEYRIFIIYINDMPACPNELEFILFADDTSIFF